MPVVALVAAGAPHKRPSIDAFQAAFNSADLAAWLTMAAVVVGVGMLLHPFQFAMTRVLEGYWGPTSIGIHAMYTRATLHLDRRRRLQDGAIDSDEEASRPPWQSERPSEDSDWVAIEDRIRLEANLEAGELRDAASRYPADDFRTLPTRLGNTLRRYEDAIGEPYGLDAIAVAPHLMLIADPEHTAYVDDARTDLDLATRFVFAWLILATVSFALLWPYDAWIAIPLAAYSGAWASYRASIAAADEYGTALQVLVDLNHHLLAERLRTLQPGSLQVQRNQRLSSLARRV